MVLKHTPERAGIPVLGEAAVEIQYNEQESSACCQRQGHNLFGRQWLMHFQKTISLATLENAKAKVDVLLKEYLAARNQDQCYKNKK